MATDETGPLIVGVSGVRGVVGRSLTPDAACRFAMALGSELVRRGGPGRVIVARDSRPSGDALKHAVFAGLMSTGCSALDVGIAPTPTVGVAVRALNARGAVQITASHNPAPWNGLKLFGPDGAVLTAADGREVAAAFANLDAARLAGWDGQGTLSSPPDVLELHLRAVLDAAGMTGQRFRVFVDGNGGAGGPLAAALLQELGHGVVQHACEPNGEFAHDPEPTPASLADVAPWVPQSGSDVGFALDPDADRLALIDETGACVSEELTLALAVKQRLSEARGPVVVNLSTSRTVEVLARGAGCEFSRSAVGEANVVEQMRRVDALLGGEGNGGVIDPRIGWVRDPFVGMALILALMAREQKPVSQLVAELPRFAMVKAKYAAAPGRLPALYAALRAKWPAAQVSDLDGLRLDGGAWWLHVRASNTEPVVRVIAEAPTLEEAQALCDAAGLAE